MCYGYHQYLNHGQVNSLFLNLIMANTNNNHFINQEDPRILLGNFDFTDNFFNLDETEIAPVENCYKTVAEQLNSDLHDFLNFLLVGHINARSVPKHISEIIKLFLECKLDIICVSETFIKAHTPQSLQNIPGFKFFKKNRCSNHGGGIGIFIRDTLAQNAKIIKLPQNLTQPECLFIELTIKNVKVAIGVMYKPPKIPYGVFATVQESLAYITTKYTHTLICGDFNINYLQPESYPTSFFQLNVAEPFGLTQVVKDPTRITSTSSTLIDLMLVSNVNNVKKVGVIDVPGISDHCLTYMAYAVRKPKFIPKTFTRRDFKNFSQDAFLHDINLAPWENVFAVGLDELDKKATIFENVFNSVLDTHAPFRTFTVKHPKSPWLTTDIKNLMNERDKQKNKFNSIKKKLSSIPECTAEHYSLRHQLNNAEASFKELRNRVNRAVRNAKIQTFNSEVNEKITFAKQYHDALKRHSVVDSKFKSVFCNIDPNVLNEAFTSYNNSPVNDIKLNEHIEKILESRKRPTFSFRDVSEEDVIKVTKSIKSNACGVDGISARYLIMSIHVIAPVITHIINCSFQYRWFPDRWKHAIIKPIPKNEDPISASDFRPISLLPAISKIAEKIACSQMCDFFKGDNELDKLQSAYKKFHSTNTALLNITDDIYQSMDKSQITILILLDYSKAFDCANHRLILAKLKAAGFQDDALSWILSYLLDRKQKVKTDLGESRWITIKNGVPQGSILGPLLFLVLVSDLYKSVCNGKYHMYADDTQLYYTCKVNQISSVINKINIDLKNVQLFSDNNCLKLNTGKSNFIIIGSRANLNKLKDQDLPPIVLNNDIIERKYHVKNLGVIFDECFSWTNHVNKIVSTAYFKLKQVSRFKNFLSHESKIAVCESYVLCHLNYCDSVYFNITEFLKYKIQKVQNTCLRFIFGLKKYDHISSCLKDLDTLNMEDRRLFHGLTLMRKIKNKIAPAYLVERITLHENIHNYNTRNRNHIAINKSNTSLRQKSFFPFFSKLYNEISRDPKYQNKSLTTFQKYVKQYLKNKR